MIYNNYRKVISSIFGDISSYQLSNSCINEVEEKLKLHLPLLLRAYYLEAGSFNKLNNAYNKVLHASEIYCMNDSLVVAHESQDILKWCIRLTDIEKEDPLVYQMHCGDRIEFYEDCEKISDFLFRMIYWQSLHGALVHSAIGTGCKSPPCRFANVLSFEGIDIYQYKDVLLSFQVENELSYLLTISSNNKDEFIRLLNDCSDIDFSYNSMEDD